MYFIKDYYTMTEKLEYGKIYTLSLPAREIKGLYVGAIPREIDNFDYNNIVLSRQKRGSYIPLNVILIRRDKIPKVYHFRYHSVKDSGITPDYEFFKEVEQTKAEEEYADWLLEKHGI